MRRDRIARARRRHDPVEVHGIIPALPTDDHAVLLRLFPRDRHRRVITASSFVKVSISCVRLCSALLVLVCTVVLSTSTLAQEPEEDEEEVPADQEAAEDEDEDDVRERGEVEEPSARRRRGEQREPDAISQLEVVLRVPLEASALPPALLDRTAFVPLRNARLASVNVDNGTINWTRPLVAEQPPAAGDDLVFVATATHLLAMDLVGGTRWSLPVSGGFAAPLLWDTGWLIASTTMGEVLCLRARDGQVLWTRHLGSPVAAQPAIAADRVYLSLNDGRVLALDLSTGTVIWEQRLGGKAGALLALDDRVFVGSADKFFYCLATADGERKWRWRTGGSIAFAPVVDGRHVYFTGLDNVLRALNRWNGSQSWMAGLPLRPAGGPLLLGDMVFVAGVGPEARGYEPISGRVVVEHTGRSDVAAPPLLIPHALPEFTSILLLTRDPELQVLRRHWDVPVVPLTEPVGVPVPLVPPPGFSPRT
jgi:outer membrane protein assembly factor BamB